MYWGKTIEGWSYWFSVTSVRNEPASTIEFHLFHGEKAPDDALPKICTLELETFAKELVTLGYERGPRPLQREWGFGKDNLTHKAGFGIGVKVYSADNGTEDGIQCVEYINIGSGILHE